MEKTVKSCGECPFLEYSEGNYYCERFVASKILNDPSMVIIEKPVPLDEFKKAVKHALD